MRGNEDLTSNLARSLPPDEAEAETCKEAAHITLAIIERLAQFGTPPQGISDFLLELFIPSYNAAIARGVTGHDATIDAIRSLLPADAAARSINLYTELVETSRRQLVFATVAAAGACAESFLLGIIADVHGIQRMPNGVPITQADFGLLMREAHRAQVFPSSQVKAAFELVRLFRNRVHPGNELRQTYRLTAQVSDIIRVILEFALLQWASR